jgi:hypothetical protein
MISHIKSPEYMEQYITKFYANKPDRTCYNGPIPVSFDTQMKTEHLVKEYMNICQRKLSEVEEEKRDMNYMMGIRKDLMKNLQTY